MTWTRGEKDLVLGLIAAVDRLARSLEDLNRRLEPGGISLRHDGAGVPHGTSEGRAAGEGSEASDPTGRDEAASRAPIPASRSVPASPESVALSVWPELVAYARERGKRWNGRPSAVQLRLLATRVREGASAEDLVRAQRGYIARNAHQENAGLPWFDVGTIYRPDRFDQNLTAGYPEEEVPDERTVKHQELLDFAESFNKEGSS